MEGSDFRGRGRWGDCLLASHCWLPESNFSFQPAAKELVFQAQSVFDLKMWSSGAGVVGKGI